MLILKFFKILSFDFSYEINGFHHSEAKKNESFKYIRLNFVNVLLFYFYF